MSEKGRVLWCEKWGECCAEWNGREWEKSVRETGSRIWEGDSFTNRDAERVCKAFGVPALPAEYLRRIPPQDLMLAADESLTMYAGM
ncbi:hypothetical protein COU20_01400 [Candidatus Kaiserbacteria bacterium CG10_big_fil_rev_8_21_14_0_10_59_10]|uniref:Uncharacterized protein n=1 Tax=Candidatus Kaiserbacteria bacterium CG10_big_fil_rev_8_21_14_0_10_59_10 TaxID=1974612 RepID=A0A2H0U862_9BACT|nr:MAG: hypothetical protein COU20_01400 [Candidatus Kaiserbacteria bacterium CG10_big_fil_rev_8_21_14_0_10_59_10]